MKYRNLLFTTLSAATLLVTVPYEAVNAQESNLVNKEVKEENTKPIIIDEELPKVYTGQPFIDLISEQAMKIGADNGIYASVMIAQAVLESNYGKSALSQSPSNNLFGVKGSFKGKGKSYQTVEDNGNGTLFQTKSKFRMYNSYNESLNDYANLIKNGLRSNANYYAGAWKEHTNSYVDAANYLEGRYATDTNYADKLIHLIKTYDLTRFDVDEYAYFIADKVIKVVEGDTLQKLAVKYNVTVDEIKKWNKLESNVILVDQELIVTIKKMEEVPTVQGNVSKVKKTAVVKATNTSQKPSKKIIKAIKKPEIVVKEIKTKVVTKKEVIEKAPVEKANKPKKKEIVYVATKYYKVQAGDSLTSIAKRNGVQPSQLKKWNKLKNASLKNGQRLIVDVKGNSKTVHRIKAQSRYVIQTGDSLAEIASRFNTTEKKLIELNHLDSSFVYEGQILFIKK
ncbi:MAG: LysM peptidoglycan-binding domain-containing protein [Kurthia sp.]|nr:LysM peptidoglycan-binding domain-containing protein [Candidatus Kurthia equi]